MVTHHLTEDPDSVWISVFGEQNADFPAPQSATSHISDDADDLLIVILVLVMLKVMQ